MSGLPQSRFTLLWAAETVSLFGTQISLLALPLVAAVTLDASASAVSALTAAGFLPIVFLGLIAGPYVDRWNLRTVMLVSNMVRAALLMCIPLAHHLDLLSLPLLLAVILLSSAVGIFFDLGYQSAVRDLVADEGLAKANSRLELSRSGAQLLGPALAGVLITTWSPSTAILLDAASFLIAGALVAMLPPLPAHRSTTARTPRLTSQIAEGLAFVRSHRILRALVVAGASSNVFFAAIIALQIVYAVRVLDLSPAQLGVGLAAEGLTAIGAAAVAAVLVTRFGELVTASLGMVAAAVGSVLLAVAPGGGGPSTLVLFMLSQAAFGLSASWFNIPIITLRQRITPRELLGRVNATSRTIIMSALPVGAGLAAVASSLLDLRLIIALCVPGFLAVVLLLIVQAARSRAHHFASLSDASTS